MFDYIKGNIIELNPAETVIECGGFGFDIMISLQTFEALQGKSSATVYLYHYLREDDEQFYGFASKNERELFKLLISVSGVGVGTARMMLSSLTDEEIRHAIIGEDVNRIKSVKGLGLKTAQRLILELKDKIVKGAGVDSDSLIPGMSVNSAVMEEATTALVMLGFTKAAVGKVLPDIAKKNPEAKVEDLIKAALKKL
ncbi:MAG: Holliday junction branch migration protein RuvA [Bacteroidales bacterium]|nr:Holliday junction branch migration protein RuvA [Bacteroidales bacterium]